MHCFFFQISIPIPPVNPRDSIVTEVITSLDEELYDVENVTVPLTICLAIMVG